MQNFFDEVPGRNVQARPELRSFDPPWYDRLAYGIMDAVGGQNGVSRYWRDAIKTASGPDNLFNAPAGFTRGATEAQQGLRHGDNTRAAWGAVEAVGNALPLAGAAYRATGPIYRAMPSNTLGSGPAKMVTPSRAPEALPAPTHDPHGPRPLNDQVPFYGEHVGPKGRIADPEGTAQRLELGTGLPGAPVEGRFNPSTAALTQGGVQPRQTAEYYRKQLQGRGAPPPGSIFDDALADLGVTRPNQVVDRDALARAIDARSPRIAVDRTPTVGEVQADKAAGRNSYSHKPTWENYASKELETGEVLPSYRETTVGYKEPPPRYVLNSEERFGSASGEPLSSNGIIPGAAPKQPPTDAQAADIAQARYRLGAYRDINEAVAMERADLAKAKERLAANPNNADAAWEVTDKTKNLAQMEEYAPLIRDAWGGRKLDAGTPGVFRDDSHFGNGSASVPMASRSSLEGWTRTQVVPSADDYATAAQEARSALSRAPDNRRLTMQRDEAEGMLDNIQGDKRFDERRLIVDEAQDQRRRMLENHGAAPSPERRMELNEAVEVARREKHATETEILDLARSPEVMATLRRMVDAGEPAAAEAIVGLRRGNLIGASRVLELASLDLPPEVFARVHGALEARRAAVNQFANADAVYQSAKNGVAPSPYTGSKAEATKHLAREVIREASDVGAGRVVWPTGDEQALRMSPNSHIEAVSYDPDRGALAVRRAGELDLVPLRGQYTRE
ncbi:MAG: hypothetical protein ACRCU1_02420, partial [Alsobacter sp.]